MKNKITFSVVSHGHERYLKRLLDQLNQQESLCGATIFVTLNLVTETFNPFIYKNLNINVINNINPKGFGKNHNHAFSFCKTPWFAILNPDLELLNNQEPFSKMLVHTCLHSNIGMIAPSVYNSEGVLQDSLRTNITPISLLLRRFRVEQLSRDSLKIERCRTGFKWLAGMCLMVNAEAFSSIGGFNEKFKLYCEDYDLCARLYLNKYSLHYDGSISIMHNSQRDSHKNPLFLYWHISSLFKVWISAEYWLLVFLALRFKDKP